MKKLTFDEIIKKWQENEARMQEKFKITKSESCLTFTQLNEYQKGVFTREQQQHVTSCDYCQKMVIYLGKHRPRPAPAKARQSELSASLKLIPKKLGEWIESLLSPIPLPVKIAVPVIVAILIIFRMTQSPEIRFAPLARIEPVAYQALVFRGDVPLTPAEKLFKEGMEFYQQKNYTQTIRNLRKSYELNPEDAGTCFYLALCYLLNNEPNRAIDYFRKVFVLKGDFLYEKTYWYLGNAYLMQEKGKKALEMFEKVIEMKGDYARDAGEMVDEVRNIK
jgi:tetratricopeptide (TPR) repeat protein